MKKPLFDEIFRKHYSDLCKIAFRKVGDFQLAEDLVQELFLEFFRRKTDFTVINNVSNYLRRSINLKAIDHLKSILKEDSQVIQLDGLDVKDKSEQIEILDDHQLYDKLMKLIEALPPKRKTVFILSRFDKKTYKEIALDLDISTKSVEKHISKALLQLRELLGFFFLVFISIL